MRRADENELKKWDVLRAKDGDVIAGPFGAHATLHITKANLTVERPGWLFECPEARVRGAITEWVHEQQCSNCGHRHIIIQCRILGTPHREPTYVESTVTCSHCGGDSFHWGDDLWRSADPDGSAGGVVLWCGKCGRPIFFRKTDFQLPLNGISTNDT
jgi:hypothetical protein